MMFDIDKVIETLQQIKAESGNVKIEIENHDDFEIYLNASEYVSIYVRGEENY